MIGIERNEMKVSSFGWHIKGIELKWKFFVRHMCKWSYCDQWLFVNKIIFKFKN